MAISTTSPAKGQSNTYNYTGKIQTFTAPIDGIYKLEVYGGQGGGNGGNGGYSVGYKKLKKNDKLYICVGGKGGDAWAGGYNGGGGGGNSNLHSDGGKSGGGATHIATRDRGVLKNYNSYRSEVLIVAGGGGSSCGDTGGTGGGTNGGNSGATGGSQTQGGKNNVNDTRASFGKGCDMGGADNFYGNGGGGGWYGGGASYGQYYYWVAGAGGGSGYIGGVPSFTDSGTTYAPSTANGKRSGAGVAYITLTKILSINNLRYNGNTPQKVFYNNVELNSVVYNNQLVFGLPLK